MWQRVNNSKTKMTGRCTYMFIVLLHEIIFWRVFPHLDLAAPARACSYMLHDIDYHIDQWCDCSQDHQRINVWVVHCVSFSNCYLFTLFSRTTVLCWSLDYGVLPLPSPLLVDLLGSGSNLLECVAAFLVAFRGLGAFFDACPRLWLASVTFDHFVFETLKVRVIICSTPKNRSLTLTRTHHEEVRPSTFDVYQRWTSKVFGSIRRLYYWTIGSRRAHRYVDTHAHM